ncbi:MAG: asparagine synthase-related protein [Silvibacterium sp.]
MAGIAGMYCADGRPANVAELKRMAVAVEHRGSDGITYWHSGPVAFAHLQFCTTPESLEERQPLVLPGGEACLVWDGRLDNREELLEALAAQGACPVDNTDPGVVLAAYLLWGTQCVQRLVGDFALAVWDQRSRQLWCARDYIGIRPFFYFWNGKTFLFAPEVCALLHHPLVSRKVNEGMAGEYLANEVTSREETLYSDIRRLPSGSTLIIDASGSFRIASWWNPDLSLLEYRTDEEYADHFRHLTEQSVQSKMRSCIPWGVPLSGGLDSSTIAVTAQALLNGSGSGKRPVSTFSLVSPGKLWDESEYISETARFAGLQTEFFSARQTDEEFFRQWAEWTKDFPDYPNGASMLVPMFDAAKRHQVRILLLGLGGNEWLDGWPLQFADLGAHLARTGAVRESWREARDEWGMNGGDRKWPVFLFRQSLLAVMPDGVRSIRKKIRLERQSIFSREFLRRTHLGDRIYASPERGTQRFASRAQELVFRTAASGLEAHFLEMNDRQAAFSGFEERYPFLDRRVGEFCLRLPREQRQRGVAWKWVLRNAMRGRLPERVRTKTIQAEFSELYEAVLYDPWVTARLKDLTIRRHTDWLDPRRFAANLNLPSQFSSEHASVYRRTWMVLGIDLWLEIVLSSGGSL